MGKTSSSRRGDRARGERSRRRLLRGHLRPANPAVIGDRMRAAEERIRGLERTNAAGRTASVHCGSDPPR